jgi:very-short-patch-repair endonuclease
VRTPNPLAPFPTREGGSPSSPPRIGEGLGERFRQPRRIVVGQTVAAVKVQRAKELRREMTEAERMLWEQLRRNQLRGFHFRRQQVIDGFIVDFYCHAANLVVEVDGEVHETQKVYDNQRDAVLSQRGLRILRIGNDEVRRNLDDVLTRIGRACEET